MCSQFQRPQNSMESYTLPVPLSLSLSDSVGQQLKAIIDKRIINYLKVR